MIKHVPTFTDPEVPHYITAYHGGHLADPLLSFIHHDTASFVSGAILEHDPDKGKRYQWINGFTGEVILDPEGSYHRLDLVIPPVVKCRSRYYLLQFHLMDPEQYRGSWLWQVLRQDKLDDLAGRVKEYHARALREAEQILASEHPWELLHSTGELDGLRLKYQREQLEKYEGHIRSLSLHTLHWA